MPLRTFVYKQESEETNERPAFSRKKKFEYPCNCRPKKYLIIEKKIYKAILAENLEEYLELLSKFYKKSDKWRFDSWKECIPDWKSAALLDDLIFRDDFLKSEVRQKVLGYPPEEMPPSHEFSVIGYP